MLPRRARKGISCICILLNTLSAGSLFCFPLYGPTLTRSLHLSMSQTSSIAVGAILGQYMTAAPFGALVDHKGPSVVSACAAGLLALGYGSMAFSLKHLLSNWFFLSAYFLLAGAGTSASYFAAISTAVKTFPHHSGLAIGIPCAVFGLAPLFMSFVGSQLFTYGSPDRKELDAVGFLTFLALSSLIVNLLSAFGLEEPEVSTFSDGKSDVRSLDETTSLLGDRPAADPNPTLKQFLSDPDAWIFGLAFLLSAGPSESVQASFGNIVEALMSVHTATDDRPFPSQSALETRTRHIQIIALVNTLARLGAGAISDTLCPDPLDPDSSSRRWKISRLVIYALSAAQFAVSLGWSSFRLDSVDNLSVLSIPTGLNLGIAFSLTPAIIAARWGLQGFGLHWGITVLFAAIGSCCFTQLYGLLSDLAASQGSETLCHGMKCFRTSFLIMSAGLAIVTVIALSLSLKRSWKSI